MERKELFMTEAEFEVLDMVYFVTGYDEIRTGISLSEEELKQTLKRLYSRGWIKLMENHVEVFNIEEQNLISNIERFDFLASKAGLKAHNSL